MTEMICLISTLSLLLQSRIPDLSGLYTGDASSFMYGTASGTVYKIENGKATVVLKTRVNERFIGTGNDYAPVLSQPLFRTIKQKGSDLFIDEGRDTLYDFSRSLLGIVKNTIFTQKGGTLYIDSMGGKATSHGVRTISAPTSMNAFRPSVSQDGSFAAICLRDATDYAISIINLETGDHKIIRGPLVNKRLLQVGFADNARLVILTGNEPSQFIHSASFGVEEFDAQVSLLKIDSEKLTTLKTLRLSRKENYFAILGSKVLVLAKNDLLTVPLGK